MAKRTYQFDVLAKIDAAVSSIKDFQSTTQKQLDSINFNTSVTAITEGFRAIKDVGVEAFHAVETGIHAAVEAANEGEEANVRLANSLRLMGDLSAGALRNFDKLADSISSTTKFSDNAVKSSLALAKQFQLTNTEAENAVKVATDLAAAQGIGLDEATKKVSQTFQGFVDRDLARMIPGLKNLGLQSLVSGNALGLISERVKGTAEALGNTFSGALQRASEQFDHLLETLGDIVIKNPAIIAGLNVIGQGFRQLNEQVGKQAGFIRGIVTDGFLLVIQAAPSFISAIQRIIQNIGFVKLIVAEAGASLGAFAAALLHPFSSSDIFKQLSDDIDEMQAKFGESINASETFFDPLIKTTQALVDKTTAAVNAARNLAPAYASTSNTIAKSVSGQEERIKGLADQFKAQIESISKDPVTVGFDLFIRKKIDLTKDDAIALGVGLVGQVVKGAAGAQKVISDTIGGIADLLLPGIGGVVSQIIDVLGQGPEKTKQMVDDFVKAIPTIIDNIAKSLPVLIEELVKTLPPALAKAMPMVAIGFTVEIVKHIPDIIKGFVQGLIDGAKGFVDALIKAVTGGLGGGNGLFGGGGGKGLLSGSGIPVVSTIGDILGLADGGRIPDVPQLGTDKALVRLNRNEQVLNGDLTDRLEKYLDGKGSGGGDVHATVQIVMDKKVLAEQLFKIRKAGYRT